MNRLKNEVGVEIDRHKIVLERPIKDTGEHEVAIKLHHDVTAQLVFQVKSAAEPKADATTPPHRNKPTRSNVEFSAGKKNSRNKKRNKWRLHRPHGQERSLVKREMALAEVRRREAAKKLFPFRQQVLRRIFTERRRTALKQSRASSVQCSSRRVKRSRNASRRLTKNIFTSRRTERFTTFWSIFGTPDKAIDLITFTQVLRDRNLLDSVGGAAFVTNLFTFVPTAANVQYYLEIVRDKYILRQIISAATESVRRAYEEQDEVDSLLDEVEQKIFDVGEDRFKGQMLSMKDHVDASHRDDREALRTQRQHHRDLHWFRRVRSDDQRTASFGNGRDCSASEHGKNRARHEHCRICGDQRKAAGRRVQLGNEQPATRATTALLPSARKLAKGARRLPGRARFPKPDCRCIKIGGGQDVHR